MTASLVAVAALLAGFHLVSRWVFAELKPPAAVFHGRSILEGSLRVPGIAVAFGVLSAIPLLRYRRTSWRALGTPQARLVIVAAAWTLAWAFASHDYNHYLDRGHAFDRLVIAGLALLVVAHPGFTGPFVLATILVVRQFEVPMRQYTWTDKALAFDLLLLFHVHVCLHAVVRHRPRALWLLALALVAGNYVDAGIGKVSLGWLERDELWNLFVAAHANGWLGDLPRPQVLAIASALESVNSPLLWATLISELAPLLWLFGRRIAIVSLAGCVLLHLGIFAASGIFFWKWVLIDLAVAAGLWTLPRGEVRALFGPRAVYLWLSIPLIVSVPWWARSVELAWYDTELNTTFELEAVGESGRVYPVARGFMSPYDVVFSQNRFYYLSPDCLIPMTFGTTLKWKIADAIRRASTAEEIRAAERKLCRPRAPSAAESSERFDRFVQRYFASVNRAGKLGGPLGPLGAPHHIWNTAPAGAFRAQERAREVRVRQVQTFYRDDRSLDVLEDRVIRVIEIPAE